MCSQNHSGGENLCFGLDAMLRPRQALEMLFEMGSTQCHKENISDIVNMQPVSVHPVRRGQGRTE